MKILIAGQFKSWALEHHYTRYLREHAEVETYPAEDVFDDFYQKSIFSKIQFRLGLSAIYLKIGNELLEKADLIKPDIILITKGMRTLPSVLKKLKSKGVYLANYNPDHPFIFSTRGSGNKNVTNSIGLFDLHLCYSKEVQQRIEREFGVNTARLPFGFELSTAQFDEAAQTEEVKRICFIGNPDSIRANYIKVMVKSGLPVDVYGHGWSKLLKATANLRIFDAVYGKTYWQKVRSYRVQVNIFRPHNEGSHNMRTFEIPAAGGIMLAPDSPEHREFFTEGKEIFLYKNKEDLIAQAKHILEMPGTTAAIIRRNARQRSLDSGYSYKHRAAQAFIAFEELLSNRKSQNISDRILLQ